MITPNVTIQTFHPMAAASTAASTGHPHHVNQTNYPTPPSAAPPPPSMRPGTSNSPNQEPFGKNQLSFITLE